MYHDPKTVLSPKERVKSVEVVYDAGPVDFSWSVARLNWDNSPVVGIRWNGDQTSSKGLPQARGNPAWFILPEYIADAVLEKARELRRKEAESLSDGYRQMAADEEQEAEAEEWTEGLIGDAY
jgi:hypothetical protein